MSFLPKDYKAPAGSSDFMKLEEGSNKVRILAEAVIGWEGWKDNKPFRRKGIECNIEEKEVDTDDKYGKEKPKISHFWAFPVYDYTEKKIKILEITQKTIMKAIQGLVDDEEWGSPLEYDIAIEKTKKGERTTYSVRAYPPKKLSKEIADEFAATAVDVNVLFADSTDEE